MFFFFFPYFIRKNEVKKISGGEREGTTSRSAPPDVKVFPRVPPLPSPPLALPCLSRWRRFVTGRDFIIEQRKGRQREGKARLRAVRALCNQENNQATKQAGRQPGKKRCSSYIIIFFRLGNERPFVRVDVHYIIFVAGGGWWVVAC